MEKTAGTPIVIIAGATATVFYGLYVLAGFGICISSFVFLTVLVVAATGILYYYIGKRRNLFVYYLVFGMIGCALGAYAQLDLWAQQQPPQTLAPLQSVHTIIVELTGEPLPAGTDYYRLPVRLIACNTARQQQFSASGTMQVLIPEALIKGTYAGGITKIKEQAELADIAMPLISTAVFLPFLRDAQPCRFYAKGLRMLIYGKFNRTATAFYARPMQPVFLGWYSALSRIRALLRFTFMRLLYEWGNAGGLLLALLAADKNFLPSECTTAFRNAGLAHILALSGMHLSLISTAALQGGALFGHKRWAIQCSLIAVSLFVWFAGSAPSLNRALGMIFIAALGRFLGLSPSLFAILCTMLTVHITFGSSDAVTLGFMLSYGACAGIMLFGDACARLILGKLPPTIVQSLSASVGAQLFTLPIVIGAIGSISAVGIIASCIVSPMVSAFLISGLIAIPLAVIIPPLSPLLGSVLNRAYSGIFFTADFFARMPLITTATTVQRIVIASVGFLLGVGITVTAYRYNKRLIQKLPFRSK